MQALIWIGAAVALAGIAALGGCIREAMRLRGVQMEPEEARRTLRRLHAWNMAAVGTAFLGLAAVTVGAILS